MKRMRNRKMKRVIGFLGIVICFYASDVYAGGDDDLIRLTTINEKVIDLEVSIHDLRVETRQEGAGTYHQLRIPEFGLTQDIGKPQLPVRGVLLGLPASGGMSLEVLENPVQRLTGYHIYPVPRSIVDPKTGIIQNQFLMDSVVYSTDSFYPEVIVREGFSGYMRDQRVAQILFYPVQFNPVSGVVIVHQKIKVRITFEQALTSSAVQPFAGIVKPQFPVVGPYEKLLEDLLINYSSLPRGN